jgi:death-on-curing protein
MILLEDILKLHKFSIQKYGGSDGLRDSGLLKSAIARPFQTFDGADLYPSAFEKAAALGESLTYILTIPLLMEIKGPGL